MWAFPGFDWLRDTNDDGKADLQTHPCYIPKLWVVGGCGGRVSLDFDLRSIWLRYCCSRSPRAVAVSTDPIANASRKTTTEARWMTAVLCAPARRGTSWTP